MPKSKSDQVLDEISDAKDVPRKQKGTELSAEAEEMLRHGLDSLRSREGAYKRLADK